MSNWTAISMVARREIRERLRSKVFRFSTAIGAIVIVGIIVIPNLKDEGITKYDVGLVNVTSPVVSGAIKASAPAIGAELAIRTVSDQATARRLVQSGDLDIALIDGKEILVKNAPDPGVLSKRLRLQLAVSEATRLPVALAEAGLSTEQIGQTLTAPPLPVQSLSKPKDRSGGAIATNVIGVIATFAFLQTYGSWVLNGVAEEKSSRIAEVLLAALRPRDLVAGKILGIGVLGLIQATVVAMSAIVASRVMDINVLRGTEAFFALGAVGWFVLGFGFYGWAFAAAGSLVSRQSEAGSASLPVMIPLFAGYFAASTSFGQADPNTLVKVLAYFPPTAPFCMPVLISNHAVAGWQIALCVLGVLVAIAFMSRVASTVYSNSILRSGKRIKWLAALRSS